MSSALGAAGGLIALGLGMAPEMATTVHCLASIKLSSSHVRDLETFAPQIELPNRDDLNLPNLSGYVLVLLSASGDTPGAAPPRTTATEVSSHSYFRARFGPVTTGPVALEKIDFQQLTKVTRRGDVALPAGLYRFRLTYIEGFSEADGPAPATLCTINSPAFQVERKLSWAAGGDVE
jgi:hypothetical protein